MGTSLVDACLESQAMRMSLHWQIDQGDHQVDIGDWHSERDGE